jgi:1-deoxy-D-xylulose-5-phosphate reductoisomerase
MSAIQQITVLGSTGSIGTSTLDVIARHPDRFSLYALTGRTQIELLAQQCIQYEPQVAVVADEASAIDLAGRIDTNKTEVRFGRQALADVASADQTDAVMAAIVGAAGLEPTLAAARAGKRILLANKESLVMSGDLFMKTCRDAGALVLPIDSEHNAVFQCLPTESASEPGISRVILTASGGPFRLWSGEEMAQATPDQACAHPNWSMGRKISVDSATMMNKGLELIEAHYLFGVSRENLDVLIHPESIVHSMVEYADGSTLAQMGNPDMRTPIAHALAWPERINSGVASLSLAQIGKLHFEEPDTTRFPCLRLAMDALQNGGAAPCILNAANEIAVHTFLAGDIGFADIARVNEHCVQALGGMHAATSIEEVLEQDRIAREMAHSHVTEIRI